MAWKTVPIINPDYQGDLVAIISEENGEGPVRINLRRDETINDMLRLKPKDASKPWLTLVSDLMRPSPGDTFFVFDVYSPDDDDLEKGAVVSRHDDSQVVNRVDTPIITAGNTKAKKSKRQKMNRVTANVICATLGSKRAHCGEDLKCVSLEDLKKLKMSINSAMQVPAVL